MKITRSAKTNLKYLTESKRKLLRDIRKEYSRVCNAYIDKFWDSPVKKTELVKSVLTIESWLSARMCQCAARESVGMILASKERHKEKAVKPLHRGTKMCLSSAMLTYEESQTSEFDGWLKFTSIGNKLKLFIPIRKHRQFNKWDSIGKMSGAWVITDNYIQFSWTIKTGPKRDGDKAKGIDTGIKALASTSDGKQYGQDIEKCIAVIKRRQHGSKGQRRAVIRLRQRMGEVAKEVIQNCDLIVVEKLTNITKNTKNPKRRLGKNMRRSIGRWNIRHWLIRLQQLAEENRVSFRSVPAYYTSQTCPSCGNVDRGNRKGTMFKCQKCNHTDNADVNAAKNIVLRFTTGRYGARFKPVL